MITTTPQTPSLTHKTHTLTMYELYVYKYKNLIEHNKSYLTSVNVVPDMGRTSSSFNVSKHSAVFIFVSECYPLPLLFRKGYITFILRSITFLWQRFRSVMRSRKKSGWKSARITIFHDCSSSLFGVMGTWCSLSRKATDGLMKNNSSSSRDRRSGDGFTHRYATASAGSSDLGPKGLFFHLTSNDSLSGSNYVSGLPSRIGFRPTYPELSSSGMARGCLADTGRRRRRRGISVGIRRPVRRQPQTSWSARRSRSPVAWVPPCWLFANNLRVSLFSPISK